MPRTPLKIDPQPDDSTCGPTCLQAVYRAYQDPVPLDQVIREVPPLPAGGTLGVQLACHALRRGYRATIYSYNLQLFDPTWFTTPGVDFAERLRAQAAHKSDPKLQTATAAYLDFLQLGGRLEFRELTRGLIRKPLRRGRLWLVGLSATYLYACAREVGDETTSDYDDLRGEPTGHFVVLYDYTPKTRRVSVADPYAENPAFETHHYQVGLDRLIGAIMLGAMTYDANLLLLEPARAHGTRSA